MSSSAQRETEALVVGAGATGLMMACELFRRGIACRIIDQSPAPAQTSRALGVHTRTLEVFQAIGIVEAVLAQGIRLSGMTIYEGEKQLLHQGLQQARSRLHSPYPFILAEPQYLLEHVLTDLLHALGGEVERSCELVSFHQEDERVLAQVRDAGGGEEEVQAKWLIGCDGAHSRTRHILGLPFAGSAYDEAFLLADVDLDWSRSREEAYIWLHPEGLLAVFPLPHDHWRLIASLPSTVAPPASLELFRQVFCARTSDWQTEISHLTWCSNFSISRRMVNRYRLGRVFLAGDAAHIHSPVGGLGMNTGLQDAYNLGWKLSLVLKGKASPSLLDTYQEERLPVARAVLHQTHRNTFLVLAKNPVLRLVRDHVLVPLLSVESIEASFAKSGSQLEITYRASSLSRSYDGPAAKEGAAPAGQSAGMAKHEVAGQGAPQAGDRAPDGPCQRAPAQIATTLFQELQGTAWSLLLFDDPQPSENDVTTLIRMAQLAERMLRDEVTPHLILSRGERAESLDWNGSVLLDPDYELHARFGAVRASLFLIRPDGYIGLRSHPAREEPLQDYVADVFTSSPLAV
jgi:2-polyprenyl-6-methoxyphenol hydroxylase-like FAD-dependent oxidoreductase